MNYTASVCLQDLIQSKPCFPGVQQNSSNVAIASNVDQGANENIAKFLIDDLYFLGASEACRSSFIPFMCSRCVMEMEQLTNLADISVLRPVKWFAKIGGRKHSTFRIKETGFLIVKVSFVITESVCKGINPPYCWVNYI